ncbi:MAG: hypothetical protein JSS10_08690 [Verrucomicrobia bacterium]|nr:hypothetical protein [Verrucomicrobiota bacterium]
MEPRFHQLLLEWKKTYLRDQDLMPIFQGQDARRYDGVKYAIKKGFLISIRRGLYLVGPPYRKENWDPFEIAQVIYGPSCISFESALSYHGWIPEAVYVTTSACARRSKDFQTPFGNFRYLHTPFDHFFLNVERITKGEAVFLMAEPWKAIADMIYCYKKKWSSIRDLMSDLRIEVETLEQSNRNSLLHIASTYKSPRVCQKLLRFVEEMS